METDTEQIELLKKVAEDVEYIKRVLSESELGDFFLTKEEEKEIEETLRQREKGELLTMKEVFGE
jgi:predicted transcriptional regulator